MFSNCVFVGKQLNEMENMYVTQNKLVEQLRNECQVQADTIQNMSTKYRSVHDISTA